MNIDRIKKIEIEITSNCNAACPGCARTLNSDILSINTITFEDIKRIFPNERFIRDKTFKFCGVLGDPAYNEECLDMVKYLTSNGGFCQLSTNGGIQQAKWWEELGRISLETKLLEIHFCVDGHEETNHIYRVNTNFDVIARNMEAYSMGGLGFSEATWIYIVFDHNEYELEKAKNHAKELGFKFATRTGMRNSMGGWLAEIKKKDKDLNKTITETKLITATGEKEHEKKEEVMKLNQFVESYTGIQFNVPKISRIHKGPRIKKKFERVIPVLDSTQTEEIVSSIKCKLIHENEIFIASNQTVWPCCFLWDSYFKDSEDIINRLSEYGDTWNSLIANDINKILDHEWFNYTLPQSWNPVHDKHFYRCIRTCGYNKAYQNIIKITD